MRILKARYRSGEELLRHYQPSLAEGGLFFPTREAMALGAPVIVEIRFPELRGKMMLRGSIAWRRGGRHRTKLRAGVGIEFHPDEAPRRDFVLKVARGGEVQPLERRHRRLPVDLAVAWRVADGRDSHQSRIEDIGPGGAFLSSLEAPPPGTEVVLDLVPPGALAPLEIAARVAWVNAQRGCGLEFRWRDAGGARRLRELVRRLEA